MIKNYHIHRKMIITKTNYGCKNWLALSVFSILNFLSLISIFLINIRLGVISSVLIFLIELYVFRLNLFKNDYAYIFFFFINILSVCAYIWNGRPISIFIAAVSYNLIPTMMYMLGRQIAIEGYIEEFAKKVLNANLFLIIFGLITYIFFSDFYYAKVGQSLDTHAWGIADYRFGSYITSINLGSACAASIPLYNMIKHRLVVWQKIVYLPCIIIALILSMQRGAWIVATIALLTCYFININIIRKKKIVKFVKALISLFAIVIAIYALRNIIFTSEQIIFFEKRIVGIDLEGMFAERTYQWKDAWEIFTKYPFGIGLGAGGHKAYSYGFSVVNDNNYLRILVELGILGFISFIVLAIKALHRCFVLKMSHIAVVLVTYLIAAMGSNVFDLFYSSFIFWMFLGIACSDNKKRKNHYDKTFIN